MAIVDAAGDVTENAKLRVVVYDSLRRRGFTPDAKADVPAAANRAGAFVDGRVSTDQAVLVRLRRELGVDVLVRVSEEWARGDSVGLRITVVSEHGAESEVYEAPSAARGQPLSRATGDLIDRAAPAAAGAQAAPEPAGDPESGPEAAPAPAEAKSGGAMTEGRPRLGQNGEPLDEASVSALWAERAGLRPMYGALINATAMHQPDWAFHDKNPETTRDEQGTDGAYGVGGGIGVRVGITYVSLSNPRVSSGSGFAGFHLGAGFDASVLYSRVPDGYKYRRDNGAVVGRSVEETNKALLYVNIPADLGFHFGIGKYRSDTIWRGTVIGFSYAPTYTYLLQIGQDTGTGWLNFAGVAGHIDLATINASRRDDGDQQIRLSAHFLPRIADDRPWLLTLGLGVVWY